MTRIFFSRELDTAASWWRIYRRDGIALGFTTHDRDLWFDGILHRAAPGMLPSAVRKTMSLADDEAEVAGALGHDTIRPDDITAGRFDDATIECGIIDWETLENASLYAGQIESVSSDGAGFAARLQSAKARLDVDPVPRASPSCRASFCGPGCTLSASAFRHRAAIAEVDFSANAVRLEVSDPARFANGTMRLLGGPLTGLSFGIIAQAEGFLELDLPLPEAISKGQKALLLEGCDKTIATCAVRFGNAINFQGEPHLPGNDLLARYPQSQ